MKFPRLLCTVLLVSTTTLFAQTAPPTAESSPLASPSSTAPPTASSSGTPPPAPRTPESAITPVEKDAKRHRQFLDRIKQGGIDLLFVGDSITDFWNRVGEKSWLKFAPLNPGNFGISGDRTEHVLWRLEHGELENIPPKLVVLMIGTNNIGHSPDELPEWAAAGVKKILDTLQGRLPEAKILLLAVFPRDEVTNPRRERVAELNKRIATFADGKTIRFLDINKIFLDEQGNIPPEIMPDRLHPSAFGYDRWYDAMRPIIDEMMK